MGRSVRDPGPRTDLAFAGALAALYLLLALVLLPSDEWMRAIGSGLLVFGVVGAVGRKLGRGHLPGGSVLGAAFASAIVLVIPTFPAMGGTHLIAVPIGFLGMQAATLLWVALRWMPLPPAAERVSLREAWRRGFIAAAALCAVATIGVVLVLLASRGTDLAILLVYPAYVIGFLTAATLFWALQRISHLATGRYLLGALGGMCCYGAIAPVVAILEHDPMNPTRMLVIAVVAGTLVGPAVALNMRDRQGDD